jgi:DNA (cytosine-5)-methyltransferase 3A
MNVLSLFDGMSCTQIALKNLGIKVDRYYASEIDKYAIKVAKENFPETIHLGDIKDIKGKDLPEIDLIVAGSPCQGFSFAGKQLAFDDPRSALFFEFVRLLREVKPKYFLLENVRMKKEFQNVISQQVSNIYPECNNGSLFGIEPIKINSALVSAQSRNRLYWTNIQNIEQPKDLRIVLKDVLENCSTKSKFTYNKPKKVGMNVEEVKVRKHEVDIKGLQFLLRSMKEQSGKTNKQIATETNMPVTKVEHWFRTDTSFAIPSDDIWFKIKDILGIETNVFDKQIMEFEYKDGVYETKQRVYSEDGKSPTLTSSNKEQYIETYDTPKQVGTAADLNGHDILKRVCSEDGKSPTLNSMGGGNREPKVAVKGGAIRGRAYDDKGKRLDKNGKSVASKTKQMLEVRKDYKSNAITTVQKDSIAVKEEELTWRKLTPLECERLQTVPDNYTAAVSNTQRYKMLGNGFTVKVIEHILTNMEK